MKTLGNILWVIFGGLEMAIAIFLEGLLCCLTIIMIPVGIQLFKLAGFVLWPFGKKVSSEKIGGFKLFVNILWAVFFGWENAVGFFLTGVIFCITIIGIPFGKQWFKMANFILTPIGRKFVKGDAAK